MKQARKVLAIALTSTFLASSLLSVSAANYSNTVPYSSLQSILNQRLAAAKVKNTPTKPQTPTSTPTPVPTTDSALLSAPVTAEEQQMLSLINKDRVANKLSPLQMDTRLLKVARMKSLDMIKNNYFSHQSPTYGSPFDMLKAQGITYRTAGENIAGNSTVTAAHTSLMNSPGHRANILSTSFSKVGIGIIKGGPYGLMISQEFIG